MLRHDLIAGGMGPSGSPIYLNKCSILSFNVVGAEVRRADAAQAQAWPLIAAGEDVLVAAPTGSGKTLAAFLWCARPSGGLAIAAGGTLADQTERPLRARRSRRCRTTCAGTSRSRSARSALAVELGYAVPEIRTAVRTGDTTARERREATRRPPHVLVTTPESLYILLTSESGRRRCATCAP